MRVKLFDEENNGKLWWCGNSRLTDYKADAPRTALRRYLGIYFIQVNIEKNNIPLIEYKVFFIKATLDSEGHSIQI